MSAAEQNTGNDSEVDLQSLLRDGYGPGGWREDERLRCLQLRQALDGFSVRVTENPLPMGAGPDSYLEEVQVVDERQPGAGRSLARVIESILRTPIRQAKESAKSEIEALNRNAERWLTARQYLTIADIERWGSHELKGHKANEDESRKADETIDRIMGPENEDRHCQWLPFNQGLLWRSYCGMTWNFEDGGPEQNGVNFCPRCGKPLRERGK